MARTPAPGDFPVDVDGLGKFTFGRRAPRDVFRIRGEYDRLTGGNYADDGSYNDFSALAFATIKQLAVNMPDGFDLEKIDPNVDEKWEATLIRVFSAMREKELSFRPSAGADSQAEGA